MRTFVVLCLLFCGLGSCAPPADKEGATGRLIGQGFLFPAEGNLFVGPGLLTLTQVVKSNKSCEGSIGSLVPPLSLSQCVENTLANPFIALEKLDMTLRGIRSDPNEHHIFLTGIENFWVQQSDLNNCWAATLQTIRDFLHLHHVSQEEMIQSTQQVCPRFSQANRGAEAYEIAFTISSVLQKYDRSMTTPHFCHTAECLVNSLTSRHPVIMLGKGHAVLLVGMDYMVRPGKLKPTVMVQRLFFLDPAEDRREVKELSSAAFCDIDVLLAY